MVYRQIRRFILKRKDFNEVMFWTWEYKVLMGKGEIYKKLPLPGFEPGFSEPQSEVLTTILQ